MPAPAGHPRMPPPAPSGGRAAAATGAPAPWQPPTRPAVDPGTDPSSTAAALGADADVPPPKRSAARPGDHLGRPGPRSSCSAVAAASPPSCCSATPTPPRARRSRPSRSTVPGRPSTRSRTPAGPPPSAADARDKPTIDREGGRGARTTRTSYQQPTVPLGEPRGGRTRTPSERDRLDRPDPDHRRRAAPSSSCGSPWYSRPVGGSARSADRVAVDTLDWCRQRAAADPAGAGWPPACTW